MQNKSHPKALTIEELKANFARDGITFSGWAKQHNFPKHEVYKVVNGFSKMRRGQGHNIAVALGLKIAPNQV